MGHSPFTPSPSYRNVPTPSTHPQAGCALPQRPPQLPSRAASQKKESPRHDMPRACGEAAPGAHSPARRTRGGGGDSGTRIRSELFFRKHKLKLRKREKIRPRKRFQSICWFIFPSPPADGTRRAEAPARTEGLPPLSAEHTRDASPGPALPASAVLPHGLGQAAGPGLPGPPSCQASLG